MLNKSIFEEIFDKSLNSIGIIDEKGEYVLINKAHEQLLGYTLEELKGKTPEIHLKNNFKKVLKDVSEKGHFSGEIECIKKDGKKITCYLTAYKIEVNGKTYYVGIKSDITEIKEKQEIIDVITNESNFGFVIYKDKFLYTNPYFKEITKYSEEDLKDLHVWDIIEPPYDKKVKENIKKRLKGEFFNYSDILPVRTKDGKVKWFYINANTISFKGEYVGITTFIDITEKKELEEKIYFLENYDLLTNLPNKELFKHQLKDLIKESDKLKENIAIILVDIYNFTEVNDTFGSHVGNEILKQISKRLITQLNIADITARYGSDEFIIAIKDPQISNIFSYITLDMLKNILQTPFQIDGNEIYLNYNLGITVYPDDADNVETLIANAEIALKQAKRKGSNEIYFFNKSVNSSVKKKINLLSELKKAIQFQEFEVYFQPKIDLSSEKIVGAEALARWKIPPNEFIPALVESNLMFEAGCIITEKALQYAGEIIKIDPDLKISINMSFEQLKYDECPQKLWDLAAKYKVPAENIIIEITETETMKNPEKNLSRLNAISEMGFKISIDDFGTGYSSLNYLKLIPASEIKIDRSFINDMLVDVNDSELVKIIVNIAKIMNLKVVAEGVENNEQAIFLKGLGCDYAQGYYFSKPVPFERFMNKITKSVKKY